MLMRGAFALLTPLMICLPHKCGAGHNLQAEVAFEHGCETVLQVLSASLSLGDVAVNSVL